MHIFDTLLPDGLLQFRVEVDVGARQLQRKAWDRPAQDVHDMEKISMVAFRVREYAGGSCSQRKRRPRAGR